MSENLSRRRFLRNAPVAVAAVSLPAAVALAGNANAADRVNALLGERDRLDSVARELGDRFDAAYDTLPWWAKAGPCQLLHNGSVTGPISGWPALQDAPRPSHPEIGRHIRPSLKDLRAWFQMDVDGQCWRPELEYRRAEIRAEYREKVRAFIQRSRAKEALWSAAGVYEIERQLKATADAKFAIDDVLVDLPDDKGDPSVIAAKVLLAMRWEGVDIDQCSGWCDDNALALLGVLRSLRPAITGALATHVGEMLDNPDRPFGELAFWWGHG